MPYLSAHFFTMPGCRVVPGHPADVDGPGDPKLVLLGGEGRTESGEGDQQGQADDGRAQKRKAVAGTESGHHGSPRSGYTEVLQHRRSAADLPGLLSLRVTSRWERSAARGPAPAARAGTLASHFIGGSNGRSSPPVNPPALGQCRQHDACQSAGNRTGEGAGKPGGRCTVSAPGRCCTGHVRVCTGSVQVLMGASSPHESVAGAFCSEGRGFRVWESNRSMSFVLSAVLRDGDGSPGVCGTLRLAWKPNTPA